MDCHVCGAPAVGTRCLFCRAELASTPSPEPQRLLDFLAAAVSGATAQRGAFDRGPIRAVALPGGFTAKLRRGELELAPEKTVEEWLALLIADLRRRAQSDIELRTSLTRQGWSLS